MPATKQQPMGRKEGFAKVNEVADYLRVSKHTVYRAIKSKELPVTVLGGSIRIKWEAVYALES